jgi:hypothetical protein
VGLTEKQAANLLHALTRRSVEDSLEEVTV